MAISAEQWALARAQWENEPLCTYAEIAESLCVTTQAVSQRAKRHGWQKRIDLPTVVAKAHAEADAMFLGEPAQSPERVTEVEPEPQKFGEVNRFPRRLVLVPPGSSPEQAQEAVQKAAVDLRAAVLEQHRNEPKAARALLYSGMKTRDGEALRNARTALQGMEILHNIERRSWGLEAEAPGKGSAHVTINVSRSGVKVDR